MAAKPRLLDLFCGAGGAAMGYHTAGFEVVGVDIAGQPRYPFEFVQADALAFPLEGFQVIHASPPCQAYSPLNRVCGYRHRLQLVEPTRDRLAGAGVPYVIENVVGARLDHGIMLCGTMFGLEVLRHRYFECNWLLFGPGRCRHTGKELWYANRRYCPEAAYRQAMGVAWMCKQEGRQAIPPVYTEWIGRQLMRGISCK